MLQVTARVQRRLSRRWGVGRGFIAALFGTLLAAGGCGGVTAVETDSGADAPLGSDATGNDMVGGDAGTGDTASDTGSGDDGGGDGDTGGGDTGTSDTGDTPGCVAQAGPDLPDDNFADTNCDGVDGDAARAIFVATSGADTNPGTMEMPMA